MIQGDFGKHFSLAKLLCFTFIIQCIIGAIVHYFSLLQEVDSFFTDALLVAESHSNRPAGNIVFIDIDDSSIEQMADHLGPWPWPRAVYAEVLEKIMPERPVAVLFDILFTEPDVYRPDSDRYFYEMLTQYDTVYLPALHVATHQDYMFPRVASYRKLPLDESSKGNPSARAHFLLPLALPEDAWRLGLINYQADNDGTGRQYSLFYLLDGWKIASLPWVVAQQLDIKKPEHERFYLNWYGGSTPFARVSFAHLLMSAEHPNRFSFKDKIVIIGASATGLHDIKSTPIDPYYPGPLILATALDNLQQGNYLLKAGRFFDWWVLLLASGILCAVSVCKPLPVPMMSVSAIMVLCLYCLGYFAVERGYLINANSNSILLFVFLFSNLLLIHIHNQKQLSNTVATFTRFMDPNVVKQLLSEDSQLDIAEPKCIKTTVLFSDIRNFTTLSEKRTPVEIVNLLNHFFDRQVKIVFKYGGTLDKFIGDAIMGFWGAPLPSLHQEKMAVLAAMEMIDEAERFSKEYGIADFSIGVGIHTGNAVVGAIGSSQRSDYTVIGDTVNLASRIEGLTKNTAKILISEATRERCESDFAFESKGNFSVKGREGTVNLFEPKRLL